MLNTKSIKKKVYDEFENTDLKKTLGIETNRDNQILENFDSASNKQIIKLHNNNLNTQKDNMKMMADIIKQREIKPFMTNINTGSQNNNKNTNNVDGELNSKNLNNQSVQENISQLQLTPTFNFNNYQKKITHENVNQLVPRVANQIKNELNPTPQIICVAQNPNFVNNQIENNIKNNLIHAEWDEDKNAYMIYDADIIEGFFTNSDIIKSIIQGFNINKYIKKYFFIIAYDKETDTNEFNFVDSVFTDNLELMIRTQNSLFDLVNHNEILNNQDQNDNLIIFNYQFIIYLFKKSNYLNNNESNKISKFYSTITYRFTCLILKHTMKIENMNITLTNDIAKIIDIKNDISSQLSNIENLLLNTDNVVNKYTDNKKSSDSNNFNNSVNFINITTSENESDNDLLDKKNEKNNNISNNMTDNTTDSGTDNETNIKSNINTNNTDKILTMYKEKNFAKSKNNKNVHKSILDEIISTLSNKSTHDNNYDSEDNNYKEINDDVTSYLDKRLSDNKNITTISDDLVKKKENVKTHYKIINKHMSTTDPSYNKNSAINNGKIYKIKL